MRFEKMSECVLTDFRLVHVRFSFYVGQGRGRNKNGECNKDRHERGAVRDVSRLIASLLRVTEGNMESDLEALNECR